ncbi:unnamed protein product [Echinostoma caproni]|uniref:DUF21 domain-containing protein n=1 Tax=Echinostoma caproni TaxID=27848 RepID=A0A183A5B7_9TREM|nr:unnamed protein product [Echinostoma caproni]
MFHGLHVGGILPGCPGHLWTDLGINLLAGSVYGLCSSGALYDSSFQVFGMVILIVIIEHTRKALRIGRPGKITVEDVTYLVRGDPKKFSRVKELLLLSEELRRARKAFEEDDYGVLK